MGVTARPRPGGFHWRPAWFVALAGAVVVLGAALGVGFGLGVFRGQGGPAPIAELSPSPVQSPVASPSPSPLPSPVASPSPVSLVAQLRGKIAISNGQPGSGGWISFPGGTFTSDSGSNVTLSPGWASGLTQVLRLGRWVPVPRDWVTPDGTRYVYTNGSDIHLVTPGSPDRMLSAPAIAAQYVYWQVLLATNSSVYVVPSAYPALAGLYRIPFSGAAQRITATGYWTYTDGTYAYGSTASAVPQGAANTIVRLTLATGARTDLFTQPGMRSQAVGVDADGNAVILALESAATPTVAQIWLARPGAPLKLYETTVSAQASAMGPPTGFTVFSVVADTMGTWISTSKGLYLYSHDAGLELASQVTGPLASAFRKAG